MPLATGTFMGYRVMQNAGFEKVAGRYFRFVAHPAADGSVGTAVAELHLLGAAFEIPDVK